MPQCFNPRTRDGCELCSSVVSASAGVSIHAPVMGANSNSIGVSGDGDVSIHAPVMGANISDKLKAIQVVVSIHAPVMGANRCLMTWLASYQFQSTHP